MHECSCKTTTEVNLIIWFLHYHSCQLSRNVRDSPGILTEVSADVPEFSQILAWSQNDGICSLKENLG